MGRSGRETAGAVSRPSAVPGYEDWPAHARSAAPFAAKDERSQALADVLGLRLSPAPPRVHRGKTTVRAGVAVTPLYWQPPFGPPTHAWELRPAGTPGAGRNPLPGILAMHPHGGRRSVGAAQLVDVDGENPLASANRLARAGFVVLAHDTFSWASRSFDLSAPPPKLAGIRDAQLALWAAQGHEPTGEEVFDAVSSAHEDLLAKTAGALGQTFAGMVLADDLVALDVLVRLPGVNTEAVAAIGFSGGGGRAHLLGALDERVSAVVISCMMATFDSLMPDYVETHSWLLHSPGLSRLCDWPALARIGKARRMLVLYGEHDPLFPAGGMLAAHDALRSNPGYEGRFFDAGHEFTPEMLEAATDFLLAWRASTTG
jgi:dienelactone hydrolase